MSNSISLLLEITKNAGDIVLQYYKNNNYSLEYKNDDKYDPVTQADIETDIFLRKEIQKNFPTDEILSEEFDGKNINYSKTVWMIDPIDGTKDFTHGGDKFCIMIGCCVEGQPILGMIYLPLKKIRYFAEKGHGSFKKEGDKVTQIFVSENDITSAKFYGKSRFSETRKIEDDIKKVLGIDHCLAGGSIGVILGEIAEGIGDGYFLTNPRAGKRDICGPQIILEEAGGNVSDANGKRILYTSPGFKLENYILASNGKFHDLLVEKCKPIYAQYTQ